MQTYAEVSTFMDNLSLHLKLNPDFPFPKVRQQLRKFLVQARSASSKIVLGLFVSFTRIPSRTVRQNTQSVVTSKSNILFTRTQRAASKETTNI